MLIPKNRHEYYLAVISGNDYPTFPPKIREEQYLAKLAGREVDVPTPRTPKERAYYNIINDIKFEPENRWQTFVAAANDDSITAPIPRTREEIWWSNISLSHEVIVEYVGTLPATLQTVEGYLESYKIYGNTEQAGTPTPENPIEPQECGEKTENLFDGEMESGYYDNNGEKQSNDYWIRCKNLISTNSNTVYHAIINNPEGVSGSVVFARCYDSRGEFIGTASQTVIRYYKEYAFTTLDNTEFISFYVSEVYRNAKFAIYQTTVSNKPYEPYGYKLPLTSAGQVVDIYLGEVETTRKIKKLVLTGEEEWQNYSQVPNTYQLSISGIQSIGNPAICSHFVNSPISKITSGKFTVGSTYIYIRYADVTDLADFKAYLAAQYAAGTPVTVWYVLAEPETGIVNEPLMKIGDYADTIDSTQSTVRIPTAAGETTVSWAGEGLAPSKVELTYKTIKKTYISADDKVYQDPNGQLLGG